MKDKDLRYVFEKHLKEAHGERPWYGDPARWAVGQSILPHDGFEKSREVRLRRTIYALIDHLGLEVKNGPDIVFTKKKVEKPGK
ncbi:MAG: hypothetical protein M0R06_25075 [Sphaerochaeta sp.]|nr:hypothetical protein [Sphaerochaeta sp.]